MITTCIFDAYGTLFDVTAAARIAASEPDFHALSDCWPQVSEDWRSKQLAYTWLRATAGMHTNFWTVTQDALDWALEAAKLDDPAIRARLLALYWELAAYPEVRQILTDLKNLGKSIGILSNGTPQMLDAAVQSAGLSDLIDASLSVESVGVFKPHPNVYDLVGKNFDCTPDQVLFVSSNGWDAAAASGYGFQTVWVNRAGLPVDRLYAKPQHILTDLTLLPESF